MAMQAIDVEYVAIKRDNMMKSEGGKTLLPTLIKGEGDYRDEVLPARRV
jgi:hypothetical protein